LVFYISLVTFSTPNATAAVDCPENIESPTNQIFLLIRGEYVSNKLVCGKPPSQPGSLSVNRLKVIGEPLSNNFIEFRKL